ncbi:MAG: GDSL family lipase [Planctomycetaceae bacterium]|nr:GDSL family lipase [Planctomycetaceae bacterium]
MNHTFPLLSAVLLLALAEPAARSAVPRPGEDDARPEPPVAVVPAPRTDEWAIARQAELLRRARESAPHDVLFVGDSITQAWEGPGAGTWKARIAPLNALNLGNSGDRTEHVLWRLREAPLTRLDAKHVVLLIGTNNLGHGTSDAAETLAGVTRVAETLAEQCPDATIHILEIFPRGERMNPMRGDICQINQALRAMVAGERAAATTAGRRPRFTILPLGDAFMRPDGTIPKEIMPDYLHLTPDAYRMWADAIVPVIR